MQKEIHQFNELCEKPKKKQRMTFNDVTDYSWNCLRLGPDDTSQKEYFEPEWTDQKPFE